MENQILILSVKGSSAEQVTHFCLAHKLTPVSIKPSGKGNYAVEASGKLDSAIHWFCDTPSNQPAPFPVGTLLWYRTL